MKYFFSPSVTIWCWKLSFLHLLKMICEQEISFGDWRRKKCYKWFVCWFCGLSSGEFNKGKHWKWSCNSRCDEISIKGLYSVFLTEESGGAIGTFGFDLMSMLLISNEGLGAMYSWSKKVVELRGLWLVLLSDGLAILILVEIELLGLLSLGSFIPVEVESRGLVSLIQWVPVEFFWAFGSVKFHSSLKSFNAYIISWGIRASLLLLELTRTLGLSLVSLSVISTKGFGCSRSLSKYNFK